MDAAAKKAIGIHTDIQSDAILARPDWYALPTTTDTTKHPNAVIGMKYQTDTQWYCRSTDGVSEVLTACSIASIGTNCGRTLVKIATNIDATGTKRIQMLVSFRNLRSSGLSRIGEEPPPALRMAAPIARTASDRVGSGDS